MNQCILVGRLGADAELKELEDGKKVINFNLAVDDGKDRPAIWFQAAKWSEKTGVLPYLKKGVQVAVSGPVGIRKWDGGATLTIRVNDLKLLGSVEPVTNESAPAAAPATASKSKAKAKGLGVEYEDDSLPF